MVKLQNNTRGTYVHGKYTLKPNDILEVPKEVAKIWLLTKGIQEYVAPADAKAEKEKYEKEIADLKAQIEELKKNSKADAKAEKEKK